MLIWGFRARSKRTPGGTFFCPKEGGDRIYVVALLRRWFTLFFIPVIPLKELGSHIECDSCGAWYNEDVLTLPTSTQMGERLAGAVRHAAVALLAVDDSPAARLAAVDAVNTVSPDTYDESALEVDLATLDVDALEREVGRLSESLSATGQENLLAACVRIALADGSASPAEVEVLGRLGAALGMTPAHVRGVLAQVETDR
jgi:hypothetical protein